jgi:RNA-binding protein Luc7-like 2
MDLGPCPKTHSDRISKQFADHLVAHPHDPRVANYKQAHENHLYGFVEDCDRRIRASQRKLEKTPEENRKTVDLVRVSSFLPPLFLTPFALFLKGRRVKWTC